MIALEIEETDGWHPSTPYSRSNLRFASDTKRAGGHFFDGRLKSVQAASAHVDRWLPMSSRLSRMAPKLRDQDGVLATILKANSVAGRTITLSWIGEDDALTTLGKGIIRSWRGGPGSVTLVVEDPILRRFGTTLRPIYSEIKTDAEEELAGRLVPQVYGRATRLPVGGGVVQSNRIELVACLGHREVTDVRYDGTLIDRSTWAADCPEENDFTYTRIAVTGDNDRDVTKFEWSGGSLLDGNLERGDSAPTISGMIRDVMVANGVTPDEFNTDSFSLMDFLMSSRGLLSAANREGAIVISQEGETLSSIIGRVQNSWGVLVYVNRDGKFEVAFPAWPSVAENQPTVRELSGSDIQWSGWGIDSPEGATEWIAQSDRSWGQSRFTRQRVVQSAANREALGLGDDDPGIRGRAIQLWYARGRTTDNFLDDRILLDRWNQLRGQTTVAPDLDIEIGDFLDVPDTERIQIPSRRMLVDGVTFSGDGFNLRKELTLTPALGVGDNPIREVSIN